jgi:uncharacterized protein YyaL (SSP411 family)
MSQAARSIATFSRASVDDLRRSGRPVGSDDTHLDAALKWLRQAQDRSPSGGVSYGYSARGGWLPPYRETSGYILTTLFRASDQLGDIELSQRALNIAEWLLQMQNADGSFSNPKYGERGIVFDTGQCLFGLVKSFERTLDERFLDAARRSGEWLVRVLGNDQKWIRSEHMGVPHTYNTRTAWALLRLNSVLPVTGFEEAARRNLDWALGNQQESGLFSNNAFVDGQSPYTHNISYAVCGLQESGWILNEVKYVEAASRCSDSVLRVMRDDGFIPAQISVNGRPAARYSCLTGQAQLAIAWARQFHYTADFRYKEASRQSLAYVKRHQRLKKSPSDLYGAVPGSYPIWGRYAPFSYPNWAVKFFVDALLLERSW